MTDRNELVDEMRGGWLDTDTLDRMLGGEFHPDDAPPGYSEVAGVLLAVAEAGDGRDLVHEAAHVTLAIELVQQRSPVPLSLDRRSRRASMGARSRSHRGKIGALVVVGAMVASTGLAAAGVLPDAAQDAFARLLDKVGITVPAGSDRPASSGEELSGTATTTDAHGIDKGAEISSAASGGMSRARQHGSESPRGGHGAPPENTPNGGGSDEASTGRNRAGSGNTSVAPSVPPRASTPPVHAH